MTDRKDHWDQVYSRKSPEDLTWFQARPETSLAFIRAAGLDEGARILDVGGGTSTLTGCLLREGFRNLGILDVSGRALGLSKARLGDAARGVEWFEGDVTTFDPPHGWELWHDRAVFHFLTEEEDRRAYCSVMGRAVEMGGHVLISTFAIDGPDRCSGLDCARYAPMSLQAELGREYQLRSSLNEIHRTPSGGTQNFLCAWFVRVG